MKPKSAHNKGKRYEKYLANCIEEAGLGKAARQIGSGSGLDKGDINANIKFLIEAKNHKNISKKLLDEIDQAKNQARIGWSWPERWALVFRDPRTSETNSEDYVVLDYHEWLELLKKDSEPRIKEPDRELKWKLKTLKTMVGQVEKLL